MMLAGWFRSLKAEKRRAAIAAAAVENTRALDLLTGAIAANGPCHCAADEGYTRPTGVRLVEIADAVREVAAAPRRRAGDMKP